MGEGNWSVAAYIGQRASDKQTEALGAIFTGVAGGPMAQLAPLIAKNLAVSKVPITFSNRPFRVKRFQTDHHHSSVDVAHGLVLLFGIGTRPFHHGS